MHTCRSVIALATILLAPTASLAEIRWHSELETAHKIAFEEGKPLLLHFYADDCLWCEKLEKGAFESPVVQEAVHTEFIPVKVHANSNPKLAKIFLVDKFPSDVVVTTSGKTLSHSVSPQDVSRYVEMLQNALSNAELPMMTTSDEEDPEKTTSPEAVQSEKTPVATTTATIRDPDGTPALSVNHATLRVPNATLRVPNSISETADTIPSEPTPPEYAAVENPVFAASTQMIDTEASTAVNALSDEQVLSLPAETTMLTETEATVEASATNETSTNLSNDDEGELATTMTLPSAMTQPAPKSSPASSIINSTDAAGDLISETEETQPTPPSPATAQPATAQPATAQSATAQPSDLAMEGYCPVTVINEDRWSEGDPSISAIHLGRLYLFSSEEKRSQFLADPEPFTPVLNEIDTVVFFEERRIVPGKREWGMKDPIHQRMFFFSDEASMNHFYQEYERYTQSAIDLMNRAIQESHQGG